MGTEREGESTYTFVWQRLGVKRSELSRSERTREHGEFDCARKVANFRPASAAKAAGNSPGDRVFVTCLLSKRRNSRAKILPDARDQPRASCEATNTSDEAARERSSVRKIRSMDISWLKRRIVETMKSIASPRRKKDASSEGSTFLSRISRLLARDSVASTSEEQSSNEVEQLCKGSGDDARETTKGNGTRLKARNAERVIFSSAKEIGAWRRVCLLFVGNRGASSSPTRRKSSNAESSKRNPAWRKTVQVEKLCTGSKVIVNSCRRGDRCQREPLVAPDTPDTPGETSETRSQTSDLTVLLRDS
ncbi:hypothetical protein WN48_07881 [Eufriesea mexicana]|uniref:Uncharacterized protein n=1 Tax=Eufriesea mexicana TaxID=516756 RepID=A0A310SP71_9HYME|nr:hypothetical protein WN48_07881 [Eufriesea mexicana]